MLRYEPVPLHCQVLAHTQLTECANNMNANQNGRKQEIKRGWYQEKQKNGQESGTTEYLEHQPNRQEVSLQMHTKYQKRHEHYIIYNQTKLLK